MKQSSYDRLQSHVGALTLLVGMLVAVTAFAWPPFPSQSPSPKKMFTKRELRLPEIVQVIEIEKNHKKLKFGAGIDADDDWLNGVTFKLKNYAERRIVFLELELDFPETVANGKNEMIFPIRLGRFPGIENQTADPVAIAPNEEVSITIDDKTYSRIRKFIGTRQPISTINQVRVVLYFVIFDDGIAWGQGQYSRVDPNDPRRYSPIGITPPQK